MLRNKRVSHYKPKATEPVKVMPVLDKSKKIIAVDFDGTIVHNKYPFIENPDMGLINFIKSNRNKYTFILWTCRHGKQLKYAVDWLAEQGIVFDLVNENAPWFVEKYGDSRKIWADYYIDDKNTSWGKLANE